MSNLTSSTGTALVTDDAQSDKVLKRLRTKATTKMIGITKRQADLFIWLESADLSAAQANFIADNAISTKDAPLICLILCDIYGRGQSLGRTTHNPLELLSAAGSGFTDTMAKDVVRWMSWAPALSRAGMVGVPSTSRRAIDDAMLTSLLGVAGPELFRQMFPPPRVAKSQWSWDSELSKAHQLKDMNLSEGALDLLVTTSPRVALSINNLPERHLLTLIDTIDLADQSGFGHYIQAVAHCSTAIKYFIDRLDSVPDDAWVLPERQARQLLNGLGDMPGHVVRLLLCSTPSTTTSYLLGHAAPTIPTIGTFHEVLSAMKNNDPSWSLPAASPNLELPSEYLNVLLDSVTGLAWHDEWLNDEMLSHRRNRLGAINADPELVLTLFEDRRGEAESLDSFCAAMSSVSRALGQPLETKQPCIQPRHLGPVR